MAGQWRRLALAFGFLTRLPVRFVAAGPGDLTRASAVFGLVGLVVAAIGVAVRAVTEPLWGPAVGAIAGVLAIVAVTGAFHEDGLADTADGVWGGYDPAQRLDIMRDSRIGTYGTVAVVGLFALRIGLLASTSLVTFATALVCGHVLGRAAGPVMVRTVPALPTSSGAGIAGRLGRSDLAVASAVTIVPVLGVAGLALGGAVVAAAVATAVLSAHWHRRRLGGVTGDTIGATTVAIEVVVTAIVVAWFRGTGV